MTEIIVGLIGVVLVCLFSFICTAILLAMIFWCFGILFSLKIALGIWLVLFLLYLFIRVSIQEILND